MRVEGFSAAIQRADPGSAALAAEKRWPDQGPRRLGWLIAPESAKEGQPTSGWLACTGLMSVLTPTMTQTRNPAPPASAPERERRERRVLARRWRGKTESLGPEIEASAAAERASERAEMQGKLFAQSRLGRDYFKECRVELTQDGQLLVDVQSGRQEDEREFNRGLDLALFDEHVRVTSKRRDNGEDLYIIKLTLAEGLQAMRLATESPQTARRWQLELQNALREARACSRVWACLRRDGVGANLLHEIETLSRVELYAVCQASRHHTFLLHEVCRALPAPCFAPSGMEPHEGSDACYRIGREVVSVLIEHGANIVHTRNGAGHLPVHVLLDACSGSCADSELTHDVLQRLLELNADGVQARADFVKRGSVYMPVHLACAALAPALVQVVVGMDNPSRRLDAFLGEAPHLLQQTARGETPLHIVTAALSRSDLDADAIARARHLCALLVSLEPEALLAVDGDGETPLHKVSRAADLEVLRVFLDSALQRTTQAASLRNNAGQSCVDLLLENQRRFACAGERDRLIPVERCVALFRIGPSATKLFSSSS